MTRRKYHFEGEERIGLAEWQTVVRSDLELSFQPVFGADGEIILGTGTERDLHAGYRCSDGEWWPLWYEERGNISSKNPPIEVIVKMHTIAFRLSAKLQGDDGELYGPSGEFIGFPDELLLG